MKTLKILEVSACGNRQAARNLKFRGDMDARIIFLFKNLLKRGHYDLISVRDIPFHALKKLQRELGLYGYRMYIHKSWSKVKQQWRYTCLSALFVANGIAFEQIYTSDQFQTTLRYVAGIILFAGHEIIYKTSHIPCVDDSCSHIEHQIERKASMLEDEAEFQQLHQKDLCISTGDYNGAPGGNFYGQEQLDKFCFSDTVLGDTYQDKTLDHVFISKALRESKDLKIVTEVLNDYYMTFTDHKVLSVTLEAC